MSPTCSKGRGDVVHPIVKAHLPRSSRLPSHAPSCTIIISTVVQYKLPIAYARKRCLVFLLQAAREHADVLQHEAGGLFCSDECGSTWHCYSCSDVLCHSCPAVTTPG